MSILTSNELVDLFPAITSERERFDLGAAVSAALERACNRVLAKRLSAASTADGVTTITVPRHNLSVGDSVRLYTQDTALNWNDTFDVASVLSVDTFTIALTPTVSLGVVGEVTMRPVRTEIQDTEGGRSFVCTVRPVAEIVSVEVADYDHVFGAALDAENILLSTETGGVSLGGEVVLRYQSLPVNAGGNWRSGKRFPRGLRVKYVAGEPLVPQDILHTVRKAIKQMVTINARNGKVSESYEDYSYTLGNVEQLSKYFGELHSLIRHYRLPVI